MSKEQREAVGAAAHELADVAVNWGGYADEGAESDARAVRRDELEARLVAAALEGSVDAEHDAVVAPALVEDGEDGGKARSSFSFEGIVESDDRADAVESRIVAALEVEGIDFDPMTVSVEKIGEVA